MHKSVLLNEAIEGLNLKDGATLLDGTFGGGGHSAEIAKRYKNMTIIALDQDANALERAKEKFKNTDMKISFVNDNFRNLDKVLEGEGISEVDGVLLDLGLSSDQLENSGRGFSFLKQEPLIMQMKAHTLNIRKENPRLENVLENTSEDLTAYEVVNTWAEESLADVIYGYGEERFSRRIAKGIVEARKKKKIGTTTELVEIIESAVPAAYRRGRLHFATRTFQALRIAVNDELGALQEGLQKGFDALRGNGRMAVITFHSLEDRAVKRFYKEKEKVGLGKIINKKVILAGEEELKSNPRARSAKLRIIEKI